MYHYKYITAILLFCISNSKAQKPLSSQLLKKYQIIKKLSNTAFVFLQEGRSGIVDISGKIICSPVFLRIENINGNLITISNDTLLGIADINGKQILPYNFEEIFIKGKNNFQVFKNGVSFIVDSQNHYIGTLSRKPKTPHFSKSLNFTPPKISEEIENSLMQIKSPYTQDSNGNFLLFIQGDSIKTQIDAIEKITGTGGFVFTSYMYKKKRMWGLVDDKGVVLLQPVYDNMQYLGKDYFKVFKNAAYGIFDVRGNEILPVKIQGFDKFDEFGYTIISDNSGNKAIINENYKIVFPFQKCNIYRLTDSMGNQNGLYRIKFSITEFGKDIILDKFMHSIIPVAYFFTGEGIENEFFVTNFKESGAVNSAGYFIFKSKYTQLSNTNRPANENIYYIVIQDEKYGLIEKNGNVILKPVYNYLAFIKDDLIKVRSELKEGIIDLKGKTVIPIEYEKIFACMISTSNNDFNFKYFQVQKDSRYGIVNEKGEGIVPLIYDFIDVTYRNGLCLAMLNNKIGYLDINGKVAIPFDYDEGYPFTRESTKVKKHGKTFYIDIKGNEVKQ